MTGAGKKKGRWWRGKRGESEGTGEERKDGKWQSGCKRSEKK